MKSVLLYCKYKLHTKLSNINVELLRRLTLNRMLKVEQRTRVLNSNMH